ncbi:MAG: sugar phosphate isomerase/epimerase [Brevibacterium sp.]|uniref:sugar phosphate isomerase/epimerase family protein n=1 Tax=Brevibacterium sp. TaxID=1701 RepID=UPI0026483D46|nr:sugar phosphate isomerase/epimerase family protein [Brevibacterium sp.]MDN5807322.1 sugar phosphate isomerase/epimerase [Brevibacterium sp.]MDN5833823.1 sugar phosphate isomerase/epimerase [Brevibacterium sp.]MDN5875903.1 sugar phosphate isomerase/epimerase [Brevibacterium sp.]MDN5909793.1 sugar phosphate isomerase/epimerase [Brevibacterium sp.]MDN6133334.1 sugar phosphate isomerase/epimerase [Brevibacterium sp.]
MTADGGNEFSVREIGVNTWVWVSPLTTEELGDLADRARRFGFGLLELPVESPGDWDPDTAAEVLAGHGMGARIVGAMGPGRDLIDPRFRADTQDYLRHCVDVADQVGSPTVAGPFTAATGRVWRMDSGERRRVVETLREALRPAADYAGERGVTLAVEPLNRYETSLINTVDQALDALEPLLGSGIGLALDSYHLNIEERSPATAIRAAGQHCRVVQVCGNDRGPVGGDRTDWDSFFDALDDIAYAGPLTLESFTADNDTIAVAASIWRPLAESQDELARVSAEFLAEHQRRRLSEAERTGPSDHTEEAEHSAEEQR